MGTGLPPVFLVPTALLPAIPERLAPHPIIDAPGSERTQPRHRRRALAHGMNPVASTRQFAVSQSCEPDADNSNAFLRGSRFFTSKVTAKFRAKACHINR